MVRRDGEGMGGRGKMVEKGNGGFDLDILLILQYQVSTNVMDLIVVFCVVSCLYLCVRCCVFVSLLNFR